MASSANPQHEPTMEEILASIRKIISEDSGEASGPKQEAEVLDLTQEVREQPPTAPYIATPQEPGSSSGPETFAASEEPVMTPMEEGAREHEGIFSEKARQAIDEAFARIDQAEELSPAEPQEPGVAAVEEHSIEAVFERAVRSAVGPAIRGWMNAHRNELLGTMKPLIRGWMDDNLPAVLEGAIREEIARVVKARGRR